MAPPTRFNIREGHPQAVLIAERARAAAARAEANGSDAAAWAELTLLAIEAGDAAAALAFGAEAARAAPQDAGVAYLSGRAARAAGDLDTAIDHYRRALALAPQFVEALISLGSCLRLKGEYPAAVAALRSAHQLAPERLEICINLGNTMADCDDWPSAAQAFRAALALQPGLPAARLGLASAQVKMGAFAEARELLEGLELEGPAAFTQYRLLGRSRYITGDHAGARAAFVEAWRIGLADPALQPRLLIDLVINCEDPEAGLPVLAAPPPAATPLLCKLARTDILVHALRLEEARKVIVPVIESGRADEDIAFSALQLSLRTTDAAESVRCVDYALASCPGKADIEFTASIALLRMGDHARGLPLYERRLDSALMPGTPEKLRKLGHHWRGGALEGRRVLVWQEQGLGDVLQAFRFTPRLRAAGASRVQWLVNGSLGRLLAAQPGIDGVHDRLEQVAPYDVHVADMSLMSLLSAGLDDIPAPEGYVSAPQADVMHWRDRLGPRDGRLRVAIAWAGNPNLDADRFRSVPPGDLAPLAEVPGVQWFNIQKGNPAAEFAGEPPFPCVDVRAELRDFADTAGLFAHMDLVISIDSAPVHLAAALGRPTWLLNRSFSEWRWMVGREDSPWYPSLRLFNQRVPRQWREVIERVAEALAALAGAGPSP